MRVCLTITALVLASAMAMAQNETVLFSSKGGFYEKSFELSLDCLYANHHIRYTTNGNTPTAESRQYDKPLYLDESLYSASDIYSIPVAPADQMYYPDQIERCIVIRAAVFDENNQRISATTTNTYFITSLGHDSHGLPLVSICADSLGLFDFENGIFVPGIHFDPNEPLWTGNYYQKGREWEREINFEFYELDNSGINQRAGMRAHGGNGRRYQQKNIAVYAREDYGKKRFKHQFFETLTINSFKHLQLKPFYSAWTQAGLQDPLCQAIACQSLEIESLATRPTILYLNGEYWGIYFIHEKPDERYLEDHFYINLDDCSIVGNWMSLCEYGDCDSFTEMMLWLEHADLTDSINFHLVESFFDLDSFIDYMAFELFFANTDWPANNMRCWRAGSGKWRWIFFDGDACMRLINFDAFANATYTEDDSWPSSSRATLLFRRLLANDSFRNRFFDRFQELIDTRFKYEETHQALTELQNKLHDEIPSQAERFGTPDNLETWYEQCEKVDDFLKHRSDIITKQISDFIQPEPWVMDDWKCFPNPFSETIYLSFHANHSETMRINIYDVMGRCVYSIDKEILVGYNYLSLQPSLSSGLYFLTMGKKLRTLIRR